MSIQKFNHYNNNTYVHLDIIKKQKDLKHLTSVDVLTTNISTPLNKFCTSLIKHEKMFNSCKKRGLSFRFGVILSFLLPHEVSKKTVADLSFKIISSYDNLPFVAWISKQGKGRYLNMYICERHYFPEGIIHQTIAQHDRYRNKITGRICSYDSANAENLQLICKVGDTISSETVYFSTKKDYFRFISGKHFSRVMNLVKNKWIEQLKEHAKCKVEKAITFHKLARRNFKAKYMNNVVLINETIASIESDFNNALYAMIFCDCYSRKAEQRMLELYNKYKDFIRDGGCKYQRYNISINPKMRNTDALHGCMELFKEKFSDDLKRVFTSIVPQEIF